MDKRGYIDAVRRESDAIVAVAQRGLAAPVPPCPGWTVGTLVGHLGNVFGGRAAIVRARSSVELQLAPEDYAAYPGIAAWFESDLNADAMPPDVLPWFEDMATGMVTALESVAPEEPMWTWFPPDRAEGLWMRRQAWPVASLVIGSPSLADSSSPALVRQRMVPL